MKKNYFLLIIIIICASGSMMASVPDWGRADTLEHYAIGPGATYTKTHYPDYPLYTFLTVIDLTNEYSKIEQVQSNNKVPDLIRESTLDQSINNTREGHRVYCAVNHDFFSYERGVCIGLNLSDGEVPFSQGNGWGRSLIAFDKDNIASVFYPKTSIVLSLTDQSEISINDINNADGEATLYNKWNVLTVSGEGIFIKIKPQGEWVFNGPATPCQVLEVSESPLQNTTNEYVIHLKGNKAQQAKGKVNVNDIINISQIFLPEKFGTPGNNIKTAFHGYPSIAFDGKLHDGEYNNFENGREYEVAPRTMLGMSKDGKTAYVMVVDGRSSLSNGINCIDIANYMLSIGTWNVVNFDSGGSTTMIINNELVNLPQGATYQRPVMDTFQAISLAPSSNEVASFSFIKPSIYPLINSKSKLLDVFAHNKYGEILDKKVEGLTFKCIPENIGFIDADGYFHAGGTVGLGYIEAEKNGIKTQLRVHTEGPDKIEFGFRNIVTDNLRLTELPIKGRKGNETQLMSAEAFTWTNSNPEVCSFQNGIIKGIKNGTSRIIGQLNDIKDTLDVTVTIATDSIALEDFTNLESFLLSTAGDAIKTVTLSNADLPLGWTDGMNINLELVKDRYPTLTIDKEIEIEGLPDSITFQLKASSEFLKSIGIYFAGTNSNQIYEVGNLSWSNSNMISLIVNQNLNTKFTIPISAYPLKIKKIDFNLKNVSKASNETIAIRDIRAYYPNKSENISINENTNKELRLLVTVENGKAFIEYTLNQSSDVSIEIYSISGVKLMSLQEKNVSAGECKTEIPLSNLNRGAYVIVLKTNAGIQSTKLIN